MRLAKVVFWIAAIWGTLVITPLYFLFDTIGRQDPPPITHPGFYYGFVGCALAWQLAFIVIATDPIRFRTLMPVAVFEKFSFGAATTVLYLQHRLHGTDLALGGIDTFFGVLFLLAFFKTSSNTASRT